MTAKVLRVVDVEGLIQGVQLVLRITGVIEIARIDGGVIVMLDGKTFFLQILGVHKAKLCRTLSVS